MINPWLICGLAVALLIVQVIEIWPEYRGYHGVKKVTKPLTLFVTLVVAIASATSGYVSYQRSLPRTLTNIQAYVDLLSKTHGLTVQVVGSGLAGYNEACRLKHQIDDIFSRAHWQRYYGECNRPPWDSDNPKTGSQLIIEYDEKAAGAMFGLDSLLTKEAWYTSANSYAYRVNQDKIIAMSSVSPAYMKKRFGDPTQLPPLQFRKLVDSLQKAGSPYPGDDAIRTPVEYPVDLIIQVFDKLP